VHLKFDGKMKNDAQPFAQNMVSFSMNMITVDDPKGKVKMKVLTSDRARKASVVDLDQQITNEEFRQRIQFLNSQGLQHESC